MQHVMVNGEAKFICMEECTRVALAVELATKAILVLQCTQCVLYIGGSVPNLTLRDCVNVEIVIGDASDAGDIETISCYGITVTTIPQGTHTFLKPSQLQASTYKNSGREIQQSLRHLLFPNLIPSLLLLHSTYSGWVVLLDFSRRFTLLQAA